MTYNFGGVSLSYKLCSLTFRNINLIYLVEKTILKIIVNTLFFMNLALLLLKYILKALNFFVFLFHASSLKGSLCIRVPKAMILGVVDLDNLKMVNTMVCRD